MPIKLETFYPDISSLYTEKYSISETRSGFKIDYFSESNNSFTNTYDIHFEYVETSEKLRVFQASKKLYTRNIYEACRWNGTEDTKYSFGYDSLGYVIEGEKQYYSKMPKQMFHTCYYKEMKYEVGLDEHFYYTKLALPDFEDVANIENLVDGLDKKFGEF